MIKYKVSYLFLLLVFLNACSNKQVSFENTEDMIANAKSQIKTISVSEFNAVFDKKGSYMLIDCRETEEFDEKNIKGSISIPRGEIEFSSNLPHKQAKIFVYSTNMDRAILTCLALKRLKYTNVAAIEGGLTEWEKEYPDAVEKVSVAEDDE